MRLQDLARPMGCFALGILVTAIYFRHDRPPAQIEEPAPGESASNKSASGDQRIAVAASETESVPDVVATSNAQPDAPPATGDEEAFRTLVSDIQAQGHAAALRRETDQLLGAGFTPERIEWIRTRSAELQAARRSGAVASDPYLDAGYNQDKDIDLVREIGEEEYDRYRLALGRSIGVRIEDANEAGAHPSALRRGDVIVRANGTRTYNGFQLTRVVRETAPGANVLVEVLRGGQQVSLGVPVEQVAGSRTESPGAALIRSLGPPPMMTFR